MRLPPDAGRHQCRRRDARTQVLASLREALRAYTVNGAYAAGIEERVGTLEPGKYADLVALSDDLFTIDPTAIESVRVKLTMVEGRIAYRAPR